MVLEAYIGYLDIEQRFKYEEYSNIGNIPTRQSPIFPFGHDFYREVVKRIDNGEYVGRKVDWSAYVAKLNKQQIQELIQTVKNINEDLMKAAKYNYGFGEIDLFVEYLDNDKLYAFTVFEV